MNSNPKHVNFYKKKHLGTFGSVGALSFNGNKIITTGSGGAILLKKKADYIKAKELINVSKINHQWKIIYKGLGYNYKMSNIQASLGCAQFNNIEKIISLKYKLLEKYKKSFKNFSQATIFELKKSRRSNYWLQTLILDKNSSKIKKDKYKIIIRNEPYHKVAFRDFKNLIILTNKL